VLRRAATDAGLDRGRRRVRFHDLRHTFASHLIIDIRLDVVQVGPRLRDEEHVRFTRAAVPRTRLNRPQRRHRCGARTPSQPRCYVTKT
jgi:integrase